MATAVFVAVFALVTIFRTSNSATSPKVPAIPVLSIVSQSFYEGDKAAKVVPISVRLRQTSSDVVTVKYTITDISAVMGKDYTANASGLISFPVGTKSADIVITVTGDELASADKSFKITLSDSQHSVIDKCEAVIIIKNDDR
jgi:chitinase